MAFPRSLARRIATYGTVSFVFTTAVVMGAVVHVNVPAARRVVARGVTHLLAPVFQGRLSLEAIDHIGWHGVDLAWVRVFDPQGHRIINVHGLHARTFLPSLLGAIVADGPLVIRVPQVRLDEVEVVIDLEASDHTVGIAQTFMLQADPLPPGLPEALPLARVVRVELPDIFILHGSVVGNDELGFPLNAEVDHVPGSLVAGSEGAQIDVQTFGLFTRAPAPLSPRGFGEYHLRVPNPDEGPPPFMWATLRGTAQEVPFVATARLVGLHLSGDVEAPSITAAQLHTLVPGFPLQEPSVSLYGTVEGDVPDLAVQARMVAGPGEASFDGILRAASPLTIDGDFRLNDLDPSSFVADVAPASLSATGHVQVALPNDTVVVAGRMKTAPTSFAGVFLPEVSLEAGFDRMGLHGFAVVYEPGATGEVTFSTDSDLRTLRLNADVHADELADMLRLNGLARGHGDVHLEGSLDPLGLHLDVQGTLDNIAVAQAVQWRSATLAGHVSGPLRDLDVTATLDGNETKLGDLAVENLHLTAAGPLLRPHLALTLNDARWRQLLLQADLNATRGPRLTNLRVAFHEAELDAEGQVDAVNLQGSTLALQGVHIDSSGGSVAGYVAIHPQGMDADLDGTFDLSRVSSLLSTPKITAGTLAFSAHVHRQGKGHEGHMAVRIENAEVAGVPMRATVGLDTLFQGTEAQATYGGSLSSLAGAELLSLQGTAAGELVGSFLDATTWRKATGHVNLHDVTLHVDPLYESEIGNLVLVDVLHLSHARGLMQGSWSVEKADVTQASTHHITLQTKGVALAYNDTKGSAATVTVEGVDALAALHLAPAETSPTQTQAELSVSLRNEHGLLLNAKADSRLNLATILRDVTTLATGSGGDSFEAAERIAALPWAAEINLPERALSTWPSFLRAHDLDGTLGGALSLTGTLTEPEVTFAVRAHNLAFRNTGLAPWAVDGSVTGHLGNNRIEAWGKLLHDNNEVAELTLTSDSSLARLLAPPPDAPPWRLGGLLVLRGFQLEALPQLTPYGVSGRVSGTVSAAGLHDRPELLLDLSMLRGAMLGREFPTATVQGRLSSSEASFLSVLLRQGGDVNHPQGGTLELSALPSLTFREGWWPALDPRHSQTLTLRATSMHIDTVAPAVDAIVADLGGYVTGELTLQIPAAAEGAAPPPSRLAGSFLWREGTFVIPQFGQTLSKGHVNLDVASDDKDVVLTLRDFQVAAKSGHVDGSFALRLPNAYVHRWVFGPPEVDRELPDITGTATLRIAEKNKIPLTFEGIPLGDAFGVVQGSVRANPTGIDVHLEVPTFTLELPKSQSRTAQDISEVEDIGVVDQKNRRNRRQQERPEPALPLRLDIVLGTDDDRRRRKSLWKPHFFVRRAGIDMGLRGQAQLTIEKEIKMTAEIEAVRGRVTVLGKPFTVDHGVVRSQQDDPANPFVEFSAYWDSPGGTRVYVEASDRFKTLTPFFRSDPPRSEASVLSLVLFGRDTSTDASVASGNQSVTGAGAGSAALGGASSVLNNLLDPVQVFGRRLETRVDTSSSRDARIGIATEISPSLWAQIDVSTATRQLRQNADASAFTLDWRFQRHWSLRTSVGNLGSSNMDLLWQYRY